MLEVRRLGAIAAIMLSAAIVLAKPAPAIDLTGAWASQGDLCKLVFTKKGKTTAFAELSDLYGAGFIIEGNRIRGKVARCTITSRKQNGDNLAMNADCATSIMHHQNVDFLFKTVDDNNIARILPNIENMEVKYTRCSF
jgi:hypothetical protein